jgi:hypothetical protein
MDLGKQRDVQNFHADSGRESSHDHWELQQAVSDWREGRKAVKWGWKKEKGKIMFYVVNAYTRAVQFVGLENSPHAM